MQVIAAEDSVALVLTRENFRAMLPQRMHPRLGRRRYASQIGTGGMQLSELTMCAVIGVGAFARVALVRHRSSAEVFALKKMDRQHLVVENMQKQANPALTQSETHASGCRQTLGDSSERHTS